MTRCQIKQKKIKMINVVNWAASTVPPIFLSLSRLSFDEKEQDRAAVEWARSPKRQRGDVGHDTGTV